MPELVIPETNCPEHALAQLTQRARQFYSLPAVVLRVLELTRDPSVAVDKLRDCVAADPAIVSKLLRVVNSSLYGLSKPVADLNQAINLLGIQRLKMLVLGFSLPTQPTSAVEPAVLERYWKHALVKSVAARELAKALWNRSADEAFVAGLLQDLGLLALVKDLGEPYVKFLNGVWSVGDDPRKTQMEVMGFDHVQLTVRLLQEWGFPPHLVSAMAHLPIPDQLIKLPVADRVTPQVLDLAELLTRFLLDHQVRWLDRLLESGKVYLGMHVDQLYDVLAQVETSVPQLAAAMTIPWTDETNYVRLLQEAHQRQAETINELATELLAPPRRPVELLAALNQTIAGHSVGPSASPAVHAPAPTRKPASSTAAPGTATTPSHSTGGSGTTPSAARLSERLNSEISNCRKARLPLSLLLVQIDDVESVVACGGVSALGTVLQSIRSVIRNAVDLGDQVVIEPVTASCLGVILVDADRQQAAIVARQVLESIRSGLAAGSAAEKAISVSMGLASLAMPPRNFPVAEMIQAAERCLNGAKLSGGNSLKSIGIC